MEHHFSKHVCSFVYECFIRSRVILVAFILVLFGCGGGRVSILMTRSQ